MVDTERQWCYNTDTGTIDVVAVPQVLPKRNEQQWEAANALEAIINKWRQPK